VVLAECLFEGPMLVFSDGHSVLRRYNVLLSEAASVSVQPGGLRHGLSTRRQLGPDYRVQATPHLSRKLLTHSNRQAALSQRSLSWAGHWRRAEGAGAARFACSKANEQVFRRRDFRSRRESDLLKAAHPRLGNRSCMWWWAARALGRHLSNGSAERAPIPACGEAHNLLKSSQYPEPGPWRTQAPASSLSDIGSS